jgi:uncharacterized protein (TIGR00369 family)
MREGLFWDLFDGERLAASASNTLGWRAIDISPENGTATIEFTATDQFLNPAGMVQGGFLTAMLDDTMGPTLIATLEVGEFAPTLELKTSFVSSARPGILICHGQIVSKGKQICHVSAELFQGEKLVATATATSLIRKIRTKHS